MVAIKSFHQQTEETLEVAVSGFNGDVGYLRNIGRNIDITVFEGDTRVVLSLIHISEPTRLRRISYAVFCLKKKKTQDESYRR